jgi:homeobox protein ESX1
MLGGLITARGARIPKESNMAEVDVTIVGKMYVPEVSHPIAPGGQPPGIWGPTDPRPTPPIYIPVVPPNVVMPPIYIPIVPSHPIVLPPPGEPPVPTHPIELPPVIWPPQPPGAPGGGAPPIASQGPGFVTPPIYIPIKPKPPAEGAPPTVEHPIYWPVYPSHPIVIPPYEGEPPEPTHPIVIPPELPPENINPEPGVTGFWGYSVYYSSPVFVPNIPSTGFPPPYVSNQPVPPQPEMPPAPPGRRG